MAIALAADPIVCLLGIQCNRDMIKKLAPGLQTGLGCLGRLCRCTRHVGSRRAAILSATVGPPMALAMTEVVVVSPYARAPGSGSYLLKPLRIEQENVRSRRLELVGKEEGAVMNFETRTALARAMGCVHETATLLAVAQCESSPGCA